MGDELMECSDPSGDTPGGLHRVCSLTHSHSHQRNMAGGVRDGEKREERNTLGATTNHVM